MEIAVTVTVRLELEGSFWRNNTKKKGKGNRKITYLCAYNRIWAETMKLRHTTQIYDIRRESVLRALLEWRASINSTRYNTISVWIEDVTLSRPKVCYNWTSIPRKLRSQGNYGRVMASEMHSFPLESLYDSIWSADWCIGRSIFYHCVMAEVTRRITRCTIFHLKGFTIASEVLTNESGGVFFITLWYLGWHGG